MASGLLQKSIFALNARKLLKARERTLAFLYLTASETRKKFDID